MSENQLLFYGTDHPFSNFHPAPIKVEGKEYPTSEHFFQAAKFFKTDPAWAESIRRAGSPGQCARMGRDRAHKILTSWDNIRDEVMRFVLYLKYTQNPDLRKFLEETGDAFLIEDSPVDFYWGWGKDHTGKNRLGKLLMELRGALRNEPVDVNKWQKLPKVIGL
ncbi:MAG: NADAR family protein [Bacteroidota bacterium]